MRSLVFLGGVSAVGKTTLLERLPGCGERWVCLSASRLIAEELGVTSLPVHNERDVLHYQEALLRAYRRQADRRPAVMDGHFTLSTAEGLKSIPEFVFRELAPHTLLLLAASPGQVRDRYLSRDQHSPPLDRIEQAIAFEREAARSVATLLAVPLYELPANETSVGVLEKLIRDLGK